MIPQRNLSLLSNRLAKKGGKRIPERIIEQDYCISWFLIGLSRSNLRNMLLFKGGTAIKKCYVPDYRFSEDLDFTLAEEATFEEILKNLETVSENTYKASGIRFYFARQDRHTHKNTYTFFMGYEGPLPGSDKEIKVDITIKEKIVCPVVNGKILKGYKEYEDITEADMLKVYSLNEISAEKIVALLDRTRNEPRDLYDVWYLADNRHVDIKELVKGVEQKLVFRGKALNDVKKEFLQKKQRLRKLWEIRLSSQMIELPEYDRIFRVVQREFRQVGI